MTTSTSVPQFKEHNDKNTEKEENEPHVVETHPTMSLG